MATYGKYFTLPGVVANADLSDKQYYAVTLTSTAGQVKVAGDTETAIAGLLQNEPESGEPAEVVCLGIAKGICESTSISRGAVVTSNSTGELQATTSDEDRVLGIALSAGSAAGDIIDVLVAPSWFGTT